MNFGYNGGKSSELIKNFQIHRDHIIINYLDNSFKAIPFTDEKEQEILAKMLKQAEERKDKCSLNSNILARRQQFVFTILNLLLIIYFRQEATNHEYTWLRPFFNWMSRFLSFTFIISGAVYIMTYKEVQELKKYAIYLEIKDDLEVNIQNSEVMSNIKSHNDALNINTLDSYSLKEIKQIKANLKNLTNSDGNKKPLIRRRKKGNK